MKKILNVRTSTLWLIAVLTTGLAYVSYLTLRFETIRLGYEVDRERGLHEKLTATRRLLALEVQSLRERQRLSTIASRSLGMGAPDTAHVVPVDGVNSSHGLGSSKRAFGHASEEWRAR
jgi:cell division protein FtsL